MGNKITVPKKFADKMFTVLIPIANSTMSLYMVYKIVGSQLKPLEDNEAAILILVKSVKGKPGMLIDREAGVV